MTEMLKIIVDIHARAKHRETEDPRRGEVVWCADLIVFYNRYYILILLSSRKFTVSERTRIYGHLIIYDAAVIVVVNHPRTDYYIRGVYNYDFAIGSG